MGWNESIKDTPLNELQELLARVNQQLLQAKTNQLNKGTVSPNNNTEELKNNLVLILEAINAKRAELK